MRGSNIWTQNGHHGQRFVGERTTDINHPAGFHHATKIQTYLQR